jgi:hypothetical protein
VGELQRSLDGWYAYFGFTEAPSSVKELDTWIAVGCAATCGSSGIGVNTVNCAGVG